MPGEADFLAEAGSRGVLRRTFPPGENLCQDFVQVSRAGGLPRSTHSELSYEFGPQIGRTGLHALRVEFRNVVPHDAPSLSAASAAAKSKLDYDTLGAGQPQFRLIRVGDARLDLVGDGGGDARGDLQRARIGSEAVERPLHPPLHDGLSVLIEAPHGATSTGWRSNPFPFDE